MILDVHSHRFPNPKKYFDYFQKWVNILGGDLHNIDPISVYNKKRICSIHFTENDMCPGSNRLKNNALPTLHLPSELTYLFIIIL